MVPSASIIASHVDTFVGKPPRSQARRWAYLVTVSNAALASKDAIYSGRCCVSAVSNSASSCSVAVSVLRFRRKPCWSVWRNPWRSHTRCIFWRRTALHILRMVSNNIIGLSFCMLGIGSVSFWSGTSHRHFHDSGIWSSVHALTMHSYSFAVMDLGRHLSILLVTPDSPGEVFVLEALIAASNSA